MPRWLHPLNPELKTALRWPEKTQSPTLLCEPSGDRCAKNTKIPRALEDFSNTTELYQRQQPYPHTLVLLPKSKCVLEQASRLQGGAATQRAALGNTSGCTGLDLGTPGEGRRQPGPTRFCALNLTLQREEIITITIPAAAAAFPTLKGAQKMLTGMADKSHAL